MAFDPSLCADLATLPNIPANTCTPDLDQVVSIAFQKIGAPSFTATTILQMATWTPLLAASDATKVIKTPILHGLTIPASEGIYDGGDDNSTAFGIREYKGEKNVTVTANLKSINPAVVAELRKLTTDSKVPGYTTIWAYFFGMSNKISGKSTGAGIPIYNVRISTLGSEGYRGKNMHQITFDLRSDWDNDFQTFVASFDPLTL
jgi:hypothetical protein